MKKSAEKACTGGWYASWLQTLRIMKLLILFVLVGTLQLSANVYSQSKVNLNLKDVSIKQLLEEIEKQTDVTFIYSDSNIDVNKGVSVKADNQSLEELLATVFRNSDVRYSMIENHVVLSAVLNDKAAYQQQTFRITGKVIDINGEPLPGVNVYEKTNPQHGVITGIDGTYDIEVDDANDALVFSYIGFEDQEIVVGASREINVTLIEEATGLDEVLVTALGIRKEAKALGYAVSKVDTERILASGTPSNALQSLYGSAAGVQVAATASGPTGGMKINIRNAVSFDASSTTRPLIVVDGVPIHDESTGMGYDATSRDNGTGINDINPDDIASFEILKGAKASVLYGSEGANGVILITTKSGKKGKGLGVSASFTTTWDKVAFLPEIQDQYGTGRSPSNTETDDQGYFLNENGERTLDYTGSAFGPKFDPNVTLNWWDGSKRAWAPSGSTVYDKMFDIGHQNTTNVALSSGGEKGTMRFSYTNMHLTPTTVSGKYNKNTFSLSASHQMNDFVKITYAGNFFMSENLNSANANSFDAQGNRTGLGAYSADIDVDLIRENMLTESGYNYYANPNMTNFFSPGRSAVANYFWDQEQNESIFKRLHSIQSLTLDVNINKIFSATVLGGMDLTNERSEYKGKLMDPSLIGPNSGSSYVDESRIIRKTYGQAVLNFNTDFDKINLSGFVGGAIRDNYLEKKGARQIGNMVIPNYFSFSNLPSGVQPTYQYDNGEDVLYSVLGSVQFAWDNQVYVEIQGRQDWSSILPPENNSYFYPGVSVSWLMDQTLTLPEWVNMAKLRASWADVGRPGPRYFSNVNYATSASGNGYILTPPSHLPPMDADGVPNLEPERKREFEVGLEAYLFAQQRIGIDFSYYASNTYNQIMAVTAPPGLGVSTLRMNAGDVANKGWELTLKTKPVVTNDFMWNLNFTFSGNKTKIKELGGDLSSLTLWSTNGLNAVAEVGGEYGLIYQQRGWQHYINPSDPNDPNNGKRIVASNGASYNYSATSNKVVGKLLPDVVGGVFTSFDYKNFRLIANFDYSFGATFISETETYMMAAGVLDETLKYRDKEHGGSAYHMVDGQKVAGEATDGSATYWDGVILDGVKADGTVNNTVVSAEDYYYESYFSNGFFPEDRIFKSDYIALRNIALDYRVPNSITNRIKLQDLTLSVFANNVAYIYRAAPNTIPESSNGTGWGNSSYGTTAMPTQRSIGVAVKVKF
ncbi:SusC/RagA family TonB-linked outer membrane protein [Carboxylicivirga mesophila]|uniref:SusC/RagA family TonB-linked outer membrane protein n=1 Tax=Carboxylicivirga mesophila TaxID=1166478 RepID=A0ABS5KD39_9BACT|nr:SusC/RagA family TonB-linked outer membrane protein [Carboxylicivirga mesophila]MBS2212923.1 SusC/RagA family TonB-linked outer membrane protein [Carboxylicivirga mesophila]